MRLLWLLLVTGVAIGADVRPCPAQAAASATIKARVRAAPKPRPPRDRKKPKAAQLQTAVLMAGAGASRAQLRSPVGEPITLDVDDTNTTLVSLLVSDPAIGSGSAGIECRWRAAGVEHAQRSPPTWQPVCEELVVRWPDFPDWPAMFSISSSVRGDPLDAGRFVAHFTVIAEY